MAESPVKIAGHPIEADGLIQQIVVRGPLHLDRKLIPGIVVRVASDCPKRPIDFLSLYGTRRVEHALRGRRPDQMVVPQSVG
jgi:hypothetical protein